MKYYRLGTLNTHIVNFLIAIYFLVIFNISLWSKLQPIIFNLHNPKLGFIISIPLLLLATFNIFFTLISIKYVEKFVYLILFVLSSLASYGMYYYGVVFDVSMIRNIMETTNREGSSYINSFAIGWLLLTAIVPFLVIYKIKIKHATFAREILLKSINLAISASIVLGIAALYYKDYASVGRNNRFLEKEIVPFNYIASTVKYSKLRYLSAKIPYQPIGRDAKNLSAHNNGKNNLLFLVIGETARSANYQLNGYTRPTNQFTKQDNVISFQDVSSCATNTAASVPCMFSHMTRKAYSIVKARKSDNLLDVLKTAGLNLLWLDNDDGCKGVCDKVLNVEIDTSKSKWCDGTYCVDEVLLEQLQSRIEQFQGKDTVIVFHVIGSHGPTYYRRYPSEHKYFQPDCARSDIQNCSQESLVNTYDNTILYTDFVIAKLIEVLKSNQSNWNAGLMYMSDHGESLGERKLYLHGTPYAFAPKEQTHVPFMLWLSSELYNDSGIQESCLRNKINQHYSHDNLFHSVLGLMNIATVDYDKQFDIFQSCKKQVS